MHLDIAEHPLWLARSKALDEAQPYLQGFLALGKADQTAVI